MNPILVDTGFIVTRLDDSQRYHAECLAVLPGMADPFLITCEAVISESCHLLRRVNGAKETILENVEKGIFKIPFSLSRRAAEVSTLIKKYADVPMDLADACLVDLATQVGSGRILTLDGDFKVYRWGRNRAFEILIDI